MKLRKTKAEKAELKAQEEYQRKMRIQKSKKNIDKFIKELDDKRDMYIQKGRQARDKGYKNEMLIAVKYVKYFDSLKDRAEKMKFQFEMGSMMKDFNGIMGDFMTGIADLSESITSNKINEKDFIKNLTKFRMSTDNLNSHSMMLEDFLADTDDVFNDMLDIGFDIDENAVSEVLGKEAKSEDATLEEVDQILNDLKKNSN